MPTGPFQLLPNDGDADITRILEGLARDQPAAPALRVPDRPTLRYADLAAQIRYVRDRLNVWDIERGDLVACVIPTRPEMALAYVTIPAAATLAPLNPALLKEEYTELLTRLRPRALVISKDLEHPARAVARQLGVTEIDLIANLAAPAGMFELELRRHDERSPRASSRPHWAVVLGTSGTTGRPKLVPISHRRLAANPRVLGERLQLDANDVGAHLQPMHHGHGLTPLSVALLGGGSIVCLPESDVDAYYAALDDYGVTWLTAGFTLHREILRRAPDFLEVIARSKLRALRNGSGWLEPEEIDRIEATFRVPLLITYGMTETWFLTADPPPPRKRKRGSVGVPLWNEVAIVSEAGIPCGPGVVGEITARGPLVFDGYFDDAEATAAAFVDGWFRTGELGHFDDDGYLFLQGRTTDIINRGGEKISPMAIDAAITEVPGVREAAAFAVPHPRLGEEIVAAVVMECGAAVEASDIIAAVRLRMGPKRLPRRIYFVDRLPRTENGKVRRAELPRLLNLDQGNAEPPKAPVARAPALTAPVEAALIGLWCSILQTDRVSATDDFFLIGGDSLLGARMLSGVSAVFGVDLSVDSLFGEAATVAGMARLIVAAHGAHASGAPA